MCKTITSFSIISAIFMQKIYEIYFQRQMLGIFNQKKFNNSFVEYSFMISL